MKFVTVEQVRKFRVLNEVMDALQSIQPRTEHLDNLDAEVLDVFGDVGNLHNVFTAIVGFYQRIDRGTYSNIVYVDYVYHVIEFIRNVERGTFKYPAGWDDEKMTEILNRELRKITLEMNRELREVSLVTD